MFCFGHSASNFVKCWSLFFIRIKWCFHVKLFRRFKLILVSLKHTEWHGRQIKLFGHLKPKTSLRIPHIVDNQTTGLSLRLVSNQMWWGLGAGVTKYQIKGKKCPSSRHCLLTPWQRAKGSLWLKLSSITETAVDTTTKPLLTKW